MEHERFLNTSISLIKTTLKGKISSEGRPGWPSLLIIWTPNSYWLKWVKQWCISK
jgi:hypothetical protein